MWRCCSHSLVFQLQGNRDHHAQLAYNSSRRLQTARDNSAHAASLMHVHETKQGVQQLLLTARGDPLPVYANTQSRPGGGYSYTVDFTLGLIQQGAATNTAATRLGPGCNTMLRSLNICELKRCAHVTTFDRRICLHLPTQSTSAVLACRRRIHWH